MEIEKLQMEIDKTQDIDIIQNFTTTKIELEQIEQEETNSQIFRSKIKWTEKGKKN